MHRQEMLDFLRAQDPSARLPIWIISYNRPNKGDAPTLELLAQWKNLENINVVVRKSQAVAYRRTYPMFNVVALPDSVIPDCGSARWAAATLARLDGDPIVMMMDDDIIRFNFMFERHIMSGKNVGLECTGHTTAEDGTPVETSELVINGLSRVALDAFAEQPNAVMGGVIKQHMSFSHKNHRTKYVVNGAATPRQLTMWHLDRLQQRDIVMDLDRFGVHGEDIGFVAQILAAGADIWVSPSFSFDHWNEDVNIFRSSIRNKDNAKRLHAEEYENLQQYPIKDYLRIKRDAEGLYEWGDVDWVKLNKLRGVPSRQFGWPGGKPPNGRATSSLI